MGARARNNKLESRGAPPARPEARGGPRSRAAYAAAFLTICFTVVWMSDRMARESDAMVKPLRTVLTCARRGRGGRGEVRRAGNGGWPACFSCARGPALVVLAPRARSPRWRERA